MMGVGDTMMMMAVGFILTAGVSKIVTPDRIMFKGKLGSYVASCTDVAGQWMDALLCCGERSGGRDG